LKEALRDKLPQQNINKSKQGFAVPVAKWLKEDLKGRLLDAFNRKKIEREGIFNYSYVNDLIREFLDNRNDTRKEIWALFMFEMWYDKWMK
jgi:asparagine synthase (glutamine-hydrolysing)